MTFTKSDEELRERRKAVSEWQRTGKVMTDAKRKEIEKNRKYMSRLEEQVDLILAGLNTSSKPKRNISQPSNSPSNIQGTVRRLANNVKVDKLAIAASQIIQEIRNESFNSISD